MKLDSYSNIDEQAQDILDRTEVLLKNAEAQVKSLNNSCNHVYYLDKVISHGDDKDYEYVCIKCGLRFIQGEKLDAEFCPDLCLIKGRGLNASYLESIFTTLRCSYPNMSDYMICQYINHSMDEITEGFKRKKVNTK